MSRGTFLLNNIYNHIHSTAGEKNSPALGSRDERTALLKAGFTGKDIESIYLILNGITIIGINWQGDT